MLLCLSVKDSRETLNHLDDLVTSVTLEATELDQLVDTLNDDALLRSPCHRDAAATLEVEETFLTEDMQCSQHGVLVHTEDGCHVLGQGKALSGSSFSLGDGPADFGRHLIMKRRCLCSVDLDIKHGTRHSRSMDVGLLGRT